VFSLVTLSFALLLAGGCHYSASVSSKHCYVLGSPGLVVSLHWLVNGTHLRIIMASSVSYQLLGPLEQSLMEYLWEHGRSNSAAVSDQIKRNDSNVSVILRKLAKKGLLIREAPQCNREGHFYTPRITKEELIMLAIERLMWDLKASPSERQRVFEAFLSQ
jgi:predicted transcriptional regulator